MIPSNDNNIENSLKQKKFKNFHSVRKVNGDKCLELNKTVKWIIDLLNDYFKDTNFNIKDIKLKSPIEDIWSTLNSINFNNSPFLTTGGKGISLDFALASGYAELMERLQIGYFFSKNPYKFILLPSHIKKISKEEKDLNDTFQNCLNQNNPFLPGWEDYEQIYVPYLDLRNMEVQQINNRFLIDATGCSAGNTYEEAFIQGLCEIFERYTAGKILLNKIKCPNIPLDKLSKKNQLFIKNLNKFGIEVIVKDFSINKKIPSAGLIFHYMDTNVKEIRVGSATSINIAVERSLTETMQIWMLSIMKKKVTTPEIGEIIKGHLNRIEDHFSKAFRLYETFPILKDYLPYDYFITMGFPRHSFYPSDKLGFLLENEGQFYDWNYYDKDCNEEVNKLLELCKKNNWRVYIRDYNWLGFPSIKIFVPELTMGYYEFRKYETKELFEFKKKLLNNINSITSDDINILTTPEFLIYSIFNNILSKFFKIESINLTNISVWEYFGLLALGLGNKKVSKLYLKQILSYKILKKNLIFLKEKEKIIPYLQKLLPNCIESCLDCKFIDRCRYPKKELLEDSIAKKHPDLFVRQYISNRIPQF